MRFCMPARCISACARTLAKAGGFEMRAAKPIRLRPRETEAHPGAPKNGNKPTGEDERDDGCLHADTGDDKTDRGQHINYAVGGLIFIELVELKLREGLTRSRRNATNSDGMSAQVAEPHQRSSEDAASAQG